MSRLAKSTASYIRIFTRLCLSQVKEQLTENLKHLGVAVNPVSFVCNGHLYSFINNSSLILEEFLADFRINPGFDDRAN